MSAHWAFWAGGVSLAAIALLNWTILRRLMAVSGRFTALVDRARWGPTPEEPAMTDAELLEAVRAATADAFGADAVDQPETESESPQYIPSPQRRPVHHVVFLASLAVGGVLSVVLAGTHQFTVGLRSDRFLEIFGASSWGTPAILLAGGMLVGFGTRMAGGCTSGHGLCGVSRGQSGSLLATASFFGMGIAVSLLLGLLS